MAEIRVTSFEDLKKYAEGEIVELPGFGPDRPFVARLKRPSVMSMIRDGKIPNELLDTANELFANHEQLAKKMSTPADLSKVFDTIDAIAAEVFVEPTVAQIKEAGLELTDEQYLFVFNYTQVGVKKVQSFRSGKKGS